MTESSAGSRRLAGHDHVTVPGRRVVPGPGARGRSAWRVPTSPVTWTCDGDMYTALSRLSKAQDSDVGLGERLKLLRDLGGPKLRSRGRRRRRRRSPRRRWFTSAAMHSKSRDARRDLAPLRRVQHVLRVGARPVMAYTCACYPTADATLEEAQEYKLDLVARKLGAQAGHAPARRRLRLGRHGQARRQELRRQGARRHAVARSRRRGRRRPSSARASRTWPRSGSWTTATCTETDFDAISSIGLTEHIGKANVPGYFKFLQRQAAGRAAGC